MPYPLEDFQATLAPLGRGPLEAMWRDSPQLADRPRGANAPRNITTLIKALHVLHGKILNPTGEDAEHEYVVARRPADLEAAADAELARATQAAEREEENRLRLAAIEAAEQERAAKVREAIRVIETIALLDPAVFVPPHDTPLEGLEEMIGRLKERFRIGALGPGGSQAERGGPGRSSTSSVRVVGGRDEQATAGTFVAGPAAPAAPTAAQGPAATTTAQGPAAQAAALMGTAGAVASGSTSYAAVFSEDQLREGAQVTEALTWLAADFGAEAAFKVADGKLEIRLSPAAVRLFTELDAPTLAGTRKEVIRSVKAAMDQLEALPGGREQMREITAAIKSEATTEQALTEGATVVRGPSEHSLSFWIPLLLQAHVARINVEGSRTYQDADALLGCVLALVEQRRLTRSADWNALQLRALGALLKKRVALPANTGYRMNAGPGARPAPNVPGPNVPAAHGGAGGGHGGAAAVRCHRCDHGCFLIPDEV